MKTYKIALISYVKACLKIFLVYFFLSIIIVTIEATDNQQRG